MGKPVWNIEQAIKVYELAKAGMTENHIARAIGTSYQTLNNWKKKKPDVKRVLEIARRAVQNRVTLKDYVYRHLSTDLRPLWDEINRLDEDCAGPEKIEAALKKGGKRARQQIFIHAWMIGNFTISRACRLVNMSPLTLQSWKKEEAFRVLWEELMWHKKNFFESSFINLVAAGDVPATLHAVQTYCKDRGYGKQVDVKVSGEVTHNIFNTEGMPIKLKKEILAWYRSQNDKD